MNQRNLSQSTDLVRPKRQALEKNENETPFDFDTAF